MRTSSTARASRSTGNKNVRITKFVDDLALNSNGGHTLEKEYTAHFKESSGSVRPPTCSRKKTTARGRMKYHDESRGGEENELVFKAHIFETCSLVYHEGRTVVITITVDEYKSCVEVNKFTGYVQQLAVKQQLASLGDEVQRPSKSTMSSPQNGVARCSSRMSVVGTRKVRDKRRRNCLTFLAAFVPQVRREEAYVS